MIKMSEAKIVIHWFRRDLRLVDNAALYHASKSGKKVVPLFIFDDNILNELPADDARVGFIYDSLKKINNELGNHSGSVLCLKGNPIEVWKKLIRDYDIEAVYFNRDYEPYAKERDDAVCKLLSSRGIGIFIYKDHVIFEPGEIVKDDGQPYTVFTPYKRKWIKQFQNAQLQIFLQPDLDAFNYKIYQFPKLSELGFKSSQLKVVDYDLSVLDKYADTRNIPSKPTTNLGPHLRFGTVGLRQLINNLSSKHDEFLSELIWREFFIQILSYYPEVVTRNFKSQYDGIQWLNNEMEFEKWCKGQTGYPLVDAGMRQLNTTGYMHNRIRMVAASFLCKHLLIDWRWGEAYFAQKLLDYELSSNNGNWQWAAATGCDAAPYFRIFNPIEQQKKFDRDLIYIRQWIPGIEDLYNMIPIVEHKFARERALKVYKNGIIRG